MSKILFFNVPAYGHVNVTIPVVHELVKHGHEVIYYCNEQFKSLIQSTGATYRAYPDTIPSSQTISKLAHNLTNISQILLSACDTLVPFVIEQIEVENPDLIMYDTINLWARIGSILTKTPSIATHSVMVLEGVDNILDMRSMLHIVVTALPKVPFLLWQRQKLAKRYGHEALKFPLFPSLADRNLVFMTRDFQMDTPFIDDSFCFVGASIHSALRSDEQVMLPSNKQPLVYISLGTVNNSNLTFYRQVLTTLADYPAQIVLSMGHNIQIDDLGEIPENIRVYHSVPQLEVLQQADVFVTHGGMNSIQESLYYGVPMLVIPQQMEQMINGRRVVELGVGQILGDKAPLGRFSPEALRPMLDLLLSDAEFRKNAQYHAQQSRSAGGYRQAVDEVEDFISAIS